MPAFGVPASVAVPSWLSVKVTLPAGSAPLSLMTIDAPVGLPVVVTVKVPAVLVLKVVLSALVITGAAWKENDTVAVELAVRFVMVYLNESGFWEPALGVKVKDDRRCRGKWGLPRWNDSPVLGVLGDPAYDQNSSDA